MVEWPRGFLRLYGSAELHKSGSLRKAIFAKLLPREQTHADTGIKAFVRIERAIDIRGKDIGERRGRISVESGGDFSERDNNETIALAAKIRRLVLPMPRSH
jgi:hypothetical protein